MLLTTHNTNERKKREALQVHETSQYHHTFVVRIRRHCFSRSWFLWKKLIIQLQQKLFVQLRFKLVQTQYIIMVQAQHNIDQFVVQTQHNVIRKLMVQIINIDASSIRQKRLLCNSSENSRNNEDIQHWKNSRTADEDLYQYTASCKKYTRC